MSEFTPPPSTPLQFDTAEFTSAPAAPLCSACKRPVVQSYFLANKAILCNECCEQFKESLYGGSGSARFLIAAAMGLGAALAGSVLWYVVRRVTGYELGLIAIVVGLMVGVAVRKGSKARGGWVYQLLAMALTYFSISAQYVPDLFEAMKNKLDKPPAAAKRAAADKQVAKKGQAEKPAPDDGPNPKHDTPAAFALVVLFLLMLALPVLIGIQNPISIVIFAFGLYEAWKINKRAIGFSGPFRLAPQTASGTPGL
jgi:hypothetical protein